MISNTWMNALIGVSLGLVLGLLVISITSYIHNHRELKNAQRVLDNDTSTTKYWLDAKANRWAIDRYTKEEALHASMTLQDCVGCIDCLNCIGCISCTNCTECIDCSLCISCTDCINSKKCVACIDCNSCNDCKHCEDCNSCTGCHQCIKCQSQLCRWNCEELRITTE